MASTVLQGPLVGLGFLVTRVGGGPTGGTTPGSVSHARGVNL